MSQDQIDAFLASAKHPSTSTTSSPPSAATQASQSKQENACPVDHENMSPEEIKEAMARFTSDSNQQQPRTTVSPTASPESKSPDTVYDVYGQQLNASNLMPATPNQLPSPGQKAPLSTDRVNSSIPKAGAAPNTTWTYPSPQMFFNALKRKGKASDVSESDMDTVVAVHNAMNERTWDEVRAWEARFHCDTCSNPKLKRFQGRPHDLSPAARIRMWFRGYPRPFDRHDWVVDRCGLAEVRYIIDYYYRDGVDPIEIHVRPAVDSFSAVYDRFRAGYHNFRAHYLGLTAMPVSPAALQSLETTNPAQSLPSTQHLSSVQHGVHLEEEEFSFLSNLTKESVATIADDVKNACESASVAMANAAKSADEAELEKANMSLNYCMAQRICAPQATAFMGALENGGDEDKAYTAMTDCLDRFHIVARRALLEATGIAQSGPEFPAGVAPRVASATASPAAASPAE